jgi:hypothetical protein
MRKRKSLALSKFPSLIVVVDVDILLDILLVWVMRRWPYEAF